MMSHTGSCFLISNLFSNSLVGATIDSDRSRFVQGAVVKSKISNIFNLAVALFALIRESICARLVILVAAFFTCFHSVSLFFLNSFKSSGCFLSRRIIFNASMANFLSTLLEVKALVFIYIYRIYFLAIASLFMALEYHTNTVCYREKPKRKLLISMGISIFIALCVLTGKEGRWLDL